MVEHYAVNVEKEALIFFKRSIATTAGITGLQKMPIGPPVVYTLSTLLYALQAADK